MNPDTLLPRPLHRCRRLRAHEGRTEVEVPRLAPPLEHRPPDYKPGASFDSISIKLDTTPERVPGIIKRRGWALDQYTIIVLSHDGKRAGVARQEFAS